MTVAATPGYPTDLLPLLTTTGTGVAISIPITSENPRIHIRSAGAVTGGTILLEECKDPDFTGTWSTIQSIAASLLGTSGELVLHIFGSIGSCRLRISSDITGGGTVSAQFVCD